MTSHRGSVLPSWATRDALCSGCKRHLSPSLIAAVITAKNQTQCDFIVLCPENWVRLGPPLRAQSHPCVSTGRNAGALPLSPSLPCLVSRGADSQGSGCSWRDPGQGLGQGRVSGTTTSTPACGSPLAIPDFCQTPVLAGAPVPWASPTPPSLPHGGLEPLLQGVGQRQHG